jgi:ABC-type multidrug transport system permease subunit
MIFERGEIMFGLNSQQTILIVKILLVLILVMIYFLPSGIARSRKHQNILAIFALNLLVGWTFFGWVGALVWSLTSPKTS